MNKSDCYDCRQKENCKLYLIAFDRKNKKSANDTNTKYPKITIIDGIEECKGLQN